MTRPELLEALVAAVAEMRKLQREYFAASRRNAYRGDLLDRARASERQVDKLLGQLGDKAAAQPSLFDEEGGS